MRGAVVLSVLVGAFAPTGATAKQPYEGVWGAAKAACTDPDGTDRMTISRDRFDWYETRCHIENRSGGNSRWTIRMACLGEGSKWRTTTRVSLPSRDRIVLENSPVGPKERQVYVRCSG